MLALNNRAPAVRAAGSRRAVNAAVSISSSSRRRVVNGSQRRNLNRYRLAAIPDEQNTGRRAGGPQDVSVGSDVPSSDTNPEMDPAESKKYREREEAEGVNYAGSGAETRSSSSSMTQQSGGRDVSDMIRDLSGGASGAASRMANSSRSDWRDDNNDQMTGRRPGGQHDVSVGSDVPSSDTNPEMDPAESPTYTKREESSGLANANTSGSSGSGERMSGSTGGMSTAGRTTGDRGMSSGSSGGVGLSPTDAADGRAIGVEIDTLSSGGSRGSGSTMPQTMNPHSMSTGGHEVLRSAEEGGGFAGSGRDLSDMLNESPGASSSSSERSSSSSSDRGIPAEDARLRAEESDSPTPRAHPVARTAGTAAASAAGTIIGAVAGPVGAAAGAALGAALGRRAADLLGGSEEQGEIYDKGEEPEQVADELRTAGSEIKEAGHTLQAKASELVDRASERISSDSGGSTARGSRGRSDRDLADMTTLSAELGSTDLVFDTESGRMTERSHKSSDRGESVTSKVSDAARSAADRVAGAAETVKDATVSAAQTAADKIGDVAGDIPLPEFPPASDHGDFHSAGGGVRLEDDKTLQAARDKVSGAAESARDRVSGAAESARDRIGSAAAEVKDRAGAAANAASERLSGARDAAADTARTAADYADSETSERLQEMGKQTSTKGQGFTEYGESLPSAGPDTDLTNAGWGAGSAGRDWGSAEAVVKTDVGTPTEGPGDISSLGAAAAAGGYGDAAADLEVDSIRSKAGGISGVESKDVGAFATRGLGEPQAGYKRDEGSGLPEGRLAAGGPDAQAAVGAEPGALSEVATSDSTAERVAQVYGVGPEASAGAEEAETYRAEAGSDRKADAA